MHIIYILTLLSNIIVCDIIHYYPEGLKKNGRKIIKDVIYSPDRSTPYLIAYKKKFKPFKGQSKINNYRRIDCEEVLYVMSDNQNIIKTKCNKLWSPPYQYNKNKSRINDDNTMAQGGVYFLVLLGLGFIIWAFTSKESDVAEKEIEKQEKSKIKAEKFIREKKKDARELAVRKKVESEKIKKSKQKEKELEKNKQTAIKKNKHGYEYTNTKTTGTIAGQIFPVTISVGKKINVNKNKTKKIKIERDKPNVNFWDDVYIKSIEQCNPSWKWDTVQWRKTENGRAILDSNEKCDIYNKYYAGRHYSVLNNQIKILMKKIKFNDKLKIIDYGSGQGYGTFTLLENIIINQIDIKDINLNLIEPSSHALNRSKRYIDMFNLKNIKNKHFIECRLDQIDKSRNFKINSKNNAFHKIHIFSNILDVADVDIKKLYNDIISNYSGYNYFIITSPLYNIAFENISIFKKLFDDNYEVKQITNGVEQKGIKLKEYRFKEGGVTLMNEIPNKTNRHPYVCQFLIKKL